MVLVINITVMTLVSLQPLISGRGYHVQNNNYLICREFILSPAQNLQINQREEASYLLNDTVIARVFVQLGFTQIDHNIREEASEATGHEEEQSDHLAEPGGGDVVWLAVNS